MTELRWMYKTVYDGKTYRVEYRVLECHLPNSEESFRVCRTYKEVVENGGGAIPSK